VDRLLGRLDLRHADARRVVDDLALKVREVDEVAVEDAERANARSGEVERVGERAARAEQQNLRVEQLLLAGLADLGISRWRE